MKHTIDENQTVHIEELYKTTYKVDIVPLPYNIKDLGKLSEKRKDRIMYNYWSIFKEWMARMEESNALSIPEMRDVASNHAMHKVADAYNYKITEINNILYLSK